jgi:5-hydroxyisourate hydrolase
VAKARPTISTHVLDLATGQPAVGFPVALFRLAADGTPALLAEAETDGDGRVRALLSDELIVGDYQIVFDVAAHAWSIDVEPEFFQNMAVGFRVVDAGRSYHVPLLLSPFGLSTYRGS